MKMELRNVGFVGGEGGKPEYQPSQKKKKKNYLRKMDSTAM